MDNAKLGPDPDIIHGTIASTNTLFCPILTNAVHINPIMFCFRKTAVTKRIIKKIEQ
jgi:hypothetical protein